MYGFIEPVLSSLYGAATFRDARALGGEQKIGAGELISHLRVFGIERAQVLEFAYSLGGVPLLDIEEAVLEQTVIIHGIARQNGLHTRGASVIQALGTSHTHQCNAGRQVSR